MSKSRGPSELVSLFHAVLAREFAPIRPFYSDEQLRPLAIRAMVNHYAPSPGIDDSEGFNAASMIDRLRDNEPGAILTILSLWWLERGPEITRQMADPGKPIPPSFQGVFANPILRASLFSLLAATPSALRVFDAAGAMLGDFLKNTPITPDVPIVEPSPAARVVMPDFFGNASNTTQTPEAAPALAPTTLSSRLSNAAQRIFDALPSFTLLPVASAESARELDPIATDLMTAVSKNNLSDVHRLLSNLSPQGKIPDLLGTLVLTAASYGFPEIVKALLDKGANPNARNSDGATGLFIATQQGHGAVVDALLAKGGDPNIPYNHRPGTTLTPLFMAAQEGHLSILKALIVARADLDAPGTDGATPLFMAAQSNQINHLPAVQALIDAGARLDTPSIKGVTPLMVATELGRLKIVDALLAAGADPTLHRKDGKTALDLAKNQQIAERLNTAMRRKDLKFHKKALFQAVRSQNLEEVRSHIAKLHGTSPGSLATLASKNGDTPVLLAVLNRNLPILQALLDAGARKLDARTADGSTALHIAVQQNDFPIVQALLNAGADIGLTNHKGATALDSANTHGDPKIIGLLKATKLSAEAMHGGVSTVAASSTPSVPTVPPANVEAPPVPPALNAEQRKELDEIRELWARVSQNMLSALDPSRNEPVAVVRTILIEAKALDQKVNHFRKTFPNISLDSFALHPKDILHFRLRTDASIISAEACELPFREAYALALQNGIFALPHPYSGFDLADYFDLTTEFLASKIEQGDARAAAARLLIIYKKFIHNPQTKLAGVITLISPQVPILELFLRKGLLPSLEKEIDQLSLPNRGMFCVHLPMALNNLAALYIDTPAALKVIASHKKYWIAKAIALSKNPSALITSGDLEILTAMHSELENQNVSVLPSSDTLPILSGTSPVSLELVRSSYHITPIILRAERYLYEAQSSVDSIPLFIPNLSAESRVVNSYPRSLVAKVTIALFCLERASSNLETLSPEENTNLRISGNRLLSEASKEIPEAAAFSILSRTLRVPEILDLYKIHRDWFLEPSNFQNILPKKQQELYSLLTRALGKKAIALESSDPVTARAYARDATSFHSKISAPKKRLRTEWEKLEKDVARLVRASRREAEEAFSLAPQCKIPSFSRREDEHYQDWLAQQAATIEAQAGNLEILRTSLEASDRSMTSLADGCKGILAQHNEPRHDDSSFDSRFSPIFSVVSLAVAGAGFARLYRKQKQAEAAAAEAQEKTKALEHALAAKVAAFEKTDQEFKTLLQANERTIAKLRNSNEDQKNSISEKTEALADMQKALDDLRGRVNTEAKLETQLSTARKQLETLKAQILATKEELAAARKDQARKIQETLDLTQQVEKLQAELTAAEEYTNSVRSTHINVYQDLKERLTFDPNTFMEAMRHEIELRTANPRAISLLSSKWKDLTNLSPEELSLIHYCFSNLSKGVALLPLLCRISEADPLLQFEPRLLGQELSSFESLRQEDVQQIHTLLTEFLPPIQKSQNLLGFVYGGDKNSSAFADLIRIGIDSLVSAATKKLKIAPAEEGKITEAEIVARRRDLLAEDLRRTCGFESKGDSVVRDFCSQLISELTLVRDLMYAQHPDWKPKPKQAPSAETPGRPGKAEAAEDAEVLGKPEAKPAAGPHARAAKQSGRGGRRGGDRGGRDPHSDASPAAWHH